MSDNFLKVYNGLALTPRSSDPANPVEGDVQFSDGTVRPKGLWQYVNGNWEKSGGSGGGGLDVYYTEDFETTGTDSFSTGNNAAFMGGGTMQGTLALDEVSPISGTKSLTYTQAAGSLNDYFASELIDIDLKQQNNDSGMTLYFQYDGSDNDMKFVVYDVTNGAELTSGVELVKVTDKAQRYALSFYVPVTCNQIRWGAQVLVENIGAVLELDDVEITSNPFVYKDLVDPRTVVRGAGNAGQSITANVTDIPFTEVEDDLGLWDGSTFTAPEDGDYIGSGIVLFSTSAASTISTYVNGILYENIVQVQTNQPEFTFIVTLDKGDILSIRNNTSKTILNDPVGHNIHIQKIPESTEHVITPAKSTPNTYSVNVGNNGTITVGTRSPDEQWWDSITRNSSGVVTIDYTSLGLTEIPGYSVTTNPGVVTVPRTAFVRAISTTSITVEVRDTRDVSAFFDEDVNVKIMRHNSDIQDATLLAAIPTPKTAYIKDVKPSGTAGGTFTAGAWQTRDLNTLEGDTGFISLSGNQVTIQPGKYKIKASAPGRFVDTHKAKLRNITDSTDDIIGTNEFADDIDNGNTRSFFQGVVVLTSTKTFEVQHRCSLSRVGDGFGGATSFGVDEIYTMLEIEKIG